MIKSNFRHTILSTSNEIIHAYTYVNSFLIFIQFSTYDLHFTTRDRNSQAIVQKMEYIEFNTDNIRKY